MVGEPAAAALPSPDPEAHALEILRQADAASRQVRWLSYDLDSSGTYAGRSRLRGRVQLELVARDPEKSRFLVEAELGKPIAWLQHYPRETVVAQDGSHVWRLDLGRGVAEKAAQPDTLWAWNPAASFITSFVPPQYFRPDPMSVEIESAVLREFVGAGYVGGVECDVVYLEFPPDSGLGEQYLFFGREDHLLRKILLTNVVESDMGPATGFDMVLTDLAWGTGPPPFGFEPRIPEPFTVVDRDAENLAVGEPVPDLELATLEGERFSLADLRGQTVVLEFWASWCPNCRVTLPLLQQVRDEFAAEPVRVLAVNVWDTEDPGRFMEEQGLDLEIVVSGSEIADALKVWASSHIIVIDPRGRIQLHDFLNPGKPREWKDSLREAVLAAIATNS